MVDATEYSDRKSRHFPKVSMSNIQTEAPKSSSSTALNSLPGNHLLGSSPIIDKFLCLSAKYLNLDEDIASGS